MRPMILALALACMSEVGAPPDAADPPDCNASTRCRPRFVRGPDSVYREACDVEVDSLGEGDPIAFTVEMPCCELTGSGGCPAVLDAESCHRCPVTDPR